jgi:hypothetical protein
VTKPHRGIFCGLARDLPPAAGEGITSHNSMQHIAPKRSEGHRPCRRPPLAECGRIRRRCVVHLLCDVIASRSRAPKGEADRFRVAPSDPAAAGEGDVFVKLPSPRGSFCKGGFVGTPRVQSRTAGSAGVARALLSARAMTARRIGVSHHFAHMHGLTPRVSLRGL